MGTLQMLLIAWGVVTAILICVWIYRSALENREDDQIFLDSAGDSMARDQREIVARIEKLSKPIVALIVLSSVLLATMAGMWIYQSIQSF
jgi:heme/copper-type cytochrome/quinol oxidase subunit 2